MLIVDSGRGCFYQKCFDPDCRAARACSNEFPLPPALLCTAQRYDASTHNPVPHAPVASPLIGGGFAEGEEDEEWSQEMLDSIDEFLRQKGLAVCEEEEEWSEDMLAGIDKFLRLREDGLQVGQDDEGSVGRMNGEESEKQVEEEEWDDELLSGIDDFLRSRGLEMGHPDGDEPALAAGSSNLTDINATSLLAAGEEKNLPGSSTADNGHRDAVLTVAPACTAAHTAPTDPISAISSVSHACDEIDEDDFDDECFQAIKEAEERLQETQQAQ